MSPAARLETIFWATDCALTDCAELAPVTPDTEFVESPPPHPLRIAVTIRADRTLDVFMVSPGC